MSQELLTSERFAVLHLQESLTLNRNRPVELRIKDRLYDVLDKIHLYRIVRVTVLDDIRTRINLYKPVVKTTRSPKRG